MKRTARFKKTLKTFLVFIIAVTMMVPTAVNASGAGRGDDGMVTINVPSNIETTITVVKEIDGVDVTFNGDILPSGGYYVTSFRVPIGGSCLVVPGTAAGYVTPDNVTVKLTGLQGSFDITISELIYELSGESVNSVTVNPATSGLIVGQSATLDATIDPSTANQAVTWSIEPAASTVATVSASGVVTAMDSGTVTIRATSVEDGSKSGTCVVTVGVVSAIDTPSTSGIVGIPVPLPTTASPSISYAGGDGAPQVMPVSWEGASPGNTITFSAPGSYTVNGYIPGTSILIAELTVNVVPGDEPAIDVTFTVNELDLYIGETGDVDFAITPAGANVAQVGWRSTDTTVANVELLDANTVRVTASSDPDNGVGSAEIIAYLGDETNVLDSFYVYVSIDPNVVEIPSIVATTFDSDVSRDVNVAVDIFASPSDVYINYYGLSSGKYYVKIEDKGSKAPLGEGEINISTEDGKFWLSETLGGFASTLKYSASYFVSMSKDPDYPSGDYEDGTPKTLMDNFKITSPVPTTPLDNIDVVVSEATGNNGVLADIMTELGVDSLEVILGRIIDESDILGTQYEDYLLPGSSVANPQYSDEVKLIGDVGADGVVVWRTPKEKLKIGGYILLIQIPNIGEAGANYDTNLDSRNIDGTYLKEVHITRNGIVYRDIIVSYD